uniref:Uncharacterized protein n=1 Tax=Seriola dumerili TaxID=41447 RepID=A0A3B4UBG1_SERDU
MLQVKPDMYWQQMNLCGSHGVQHVWCGPGQDYHSVVHGGVLIWGCFSARGVGEMTFIGVKTMTWPSLSPEMNPVQHLRSILNLRCSGNISNIRSM